MTTAAWVLLAVAAVFAVGNWIAVAVGSKPAEYVCKPATLVLLIAVALTLDPVHDDMRTWFVAALVLSLLGDIFLMLPATGSSSGSAPSSSATSRTPSDSTSTPTASGCSRSRSRWSRRSSRSVSCGASGGGARTRSSRR